MALSRYQKWREDRRRFPVHWLTYRRRVRDDVENLYKSENGPAFFDDKFAAALTASTKQLEEWEIKLIVFQLGISVFIVLGLITTDASISLLGISLKHVKGMKELLLALSASLAVISSVVTQSKHLRLVVLEKLMELRTEEKFQPFAKLASPSAFHITPYIAREFERWIFSRFLTGATMFLIAFLYALVVILLLAFSVSLWVFLYLEILRAPGLGLWSYLALAYSCAAHLLCVLCLVRMHAPLPFRDMQVLRELRDLQRGNPALYAKRLQEVYGTKAG